MRKLFLLTCLITLCKTIEAQQPDLAIGIDLGFVASNKTENLGMAGIHADFLRNLITIHLGSVIRDNFPTTRNEIGIYTDGHVDGLGWWNTFIQPSLIGGGRVLLFKPKNIESQFYYGVGATFKNQNTGDRFTLFWERTWSGINSLRMSIAMNIFGSWGEKSKLKKREIYFARCPTF